jgi:hypothetical protein
MGRTGSQFRPIKPDKDDFSVEIVLRVKLAVSVLELSDLGYNHNAVLTVGPIQPPLMCLRIEQTQREAFDVTG